MHVCCMWREGDVRAVAKAPLSGWCHAPRRGHLVFWIRHAFGHALCTLYTRVQCRSSGFVAQTRPVLYTPPCSQKMTTNRLTVDAQNQMNLNEVKTILKEIFNPKALDLHFRSSLRLWWNQKLSEHWKSIIQFGCLSFSVRISSITDMCKFLNICYTISTSHSNDLKSGKL